MSIDGGCDSVTRVGAPIDVYIEAGTRRVFAAALDWPGWARSGRDERAALEALLASAPRYGQVVSHARLGFVAPREMADLRVTERLPGDATTDFGAPGAVPKRDTMPVSDADLRRLLAIIGAAWRAFDDAARRARGKLLATGPRGGGRALDAIATHVREAEAGYLAALGWKLAAGATAEASRAAVRDGLAASVRGEIPAKGPRGGARTRPRVFARRLAWHALDHAWEIEDRQAASGAKDVEVHGLGRRRRIDP